MAGGFATPKQARPYWETATASDLARSEFDTLFYTLAPLYPGRRGLQAVRPDLLGEALVAQALLRSEGTSLLDAALEPTASHAVRHHALTVLSRLSSQRLDLHEVLVESLTRNARHCLQDAAVVATETLGDLPRLVETAFGRAPPAIKSQVAGLLRPLLQEESVQLAEFACVVTEYLVEKSSQKQSRKALSAAAMAEYAKVLDDHAVMLCRAGRYEAAPEPARQALEIRRRLAQTRSDRYEPDYARSLSNYAGHLREVGQSEAALEPARQASEILRRLAQTRLDRYEPEYATSLSNYAEHLREVGQSEVALEHARQALDIRRRLAQIRPDRCEPDYAISLNNYTNHLSAVGQSEAALEHAREALEIQRRLAQTRPDRYEPKYGGSLHNYAIRLSEVGQSVAGLQQAVQSLAIYNRLAVHRPERFNYNVNNTACLMRFLSWVCDRTAIDCALPDPDAIPPTIHPHRRYELEVNAAFLRACLASEEASRRDAFKRMESAWGSLTVAGKTATRANWLCAAAWCATHAPDVLGVPDWQTQWQSFVTQRKGHIPWWMLEVARRLSFRWPQ